MTTDMERDKELYALGAGAFEEQPLISINYRTR